jgi:hypothetical protein
MAHTGRVGMVLLGWVGCAAPAAWEDSGARDGREDVDEDRLARRGGGGGVASWPANRRGTQIGGALSAVYEPSGAWWHPELGVLLLVSDEGVVSEIGLDGAMVADWTFAGDFEAITVADASSDFAYVGIERPDSIVELDLATGTLTGRTWALDAWMASADPNLGLEALTFVPDGAHPYASGGSGGLFYAGLQETGDIYVFDVDLASSGTVTHVDTLATGRADLSDLYFHAESGVLYALFDTDDVLREMTPAGVTLAEYQAPGTEQEGVTLVPGCPRTSTTIAIAEDAGPSVKTYTRYPLTCG